MVNSSSKVTRFFFVTSLSLLLGETSHFCFAEGVVPAGYGENGVNRRVMTPAEGYVKVSGTFSEPTSFRVPGSYRVDLTTGLHVYTGGNTYRSEPSFYLGSVYNTYAVDAGFQWDYQIDGYTDGAWTALIRARGGWTNYSDNPAGRVAWSTPRETLGTVGMVYQVQENGAVDLNVTTGYAGHFHFGSASNSQRAFNNGSISVPVYADPAGTVNGINTGDALRHMAVKRVVAMTQDGGNIDGSFMKDTGFSTGQVFKWQRDAAGTFTYSPIEGGWPLVAVDQNNTGYDTGGWAYDPSLSVSDKRRWIVDFDFNGMSNPSLRGPGDPTFPNGEYRNSAVATRYTDHESVTITLGVPPGHVKGEAVR